MLRRTLVVVAVVALLAPALGAPAGAGAPAVAHTKRDLEIASFDNTTLAITVFQPATASADAPVPVIVRSHGWAGSRDKEIGGFVEDLLDAGYGVVTFDARGHGGSGGVARVHHPDYEIRDVSVLYDWMYDNLDWALREGDPAAKDLVMGGSGGSYGGGWQLLSAALDGRIDVLVPEITWSSLPQSLAPNGAINSGWVHLLYLGGKARAKLHPDIDRWYAEVMLTNRVPADALRHFEASSVYPYVGAIRQPTLLVQGVPDTLFNLNQALANYDGIRANGADVKVFTHRGGHLLTAVFVDSRFPDVGFPQPGNKGSPCGDVDAAAIRWYDEHLKGVSPETPLATFSFAMDDGTCLATEELPERRSWLTAPGAALPPHVGSVLVPLHDADAPLRIVGVPVLEAERAVVAAVDDIVYASLFVVAADGSTRVASSQVTPLRLAGPGTTPVRLEMGGVATALQPGDTLFLRLDRVNEFYATNSGRTPGAIVLEGLTLRFGVA